MGFCGSAQKDSGVPEAPGGCTKEVSDETRSPGVPVLHGCFRGFFRVWDYAAIPAIGFP
jgi:hypothetical protein